MLRKGLMISNSWKSRRWGTIWRKRRKGKRNYRKSWASCKVRRM